MAQSNTPSAIRSRARRERIKAEKLAAADAHDAAAREERIKAEQAERDERDKAAEQAENGRKRAPSRHPRIRVPGHKLTITWSGERKREESSSTGTCICGWSESGSNREIVRDEYTHHLQHEAELLARKAAEEVTA